jgi:hypothetical protein
MRRLFIPPAMLCAVTLLAAITPARHPAQQPVNTPPEQRPTVATPPAAQPGQRPSPSPAAKELFDIATRFEGSLALGSPEKRGDAPEVSIRVWTIYDHQRIDRFAEQGFIIAHLRAGELITVINGARQERREDEFWTVPEGATMSIETDRDTATLQTWAIRKAGNLR